MNPEELETFDQADTEKVIMIQAVARRNQAAKKAEEKRQASYQQEDEATTQSRQPQHNTTNNDEDEDEITLPTDAEVEEYLGDDPCASTRRSRVAHLATMSQSASNSQGVGSAASLPPHVRVALLNQQSEAFAARRPHPFSTVDYSKGLAIKEDGDASAGSLAGLKTFLSSQRAYW